MYLKASFGWLVIMYHIQQYQDGDFVFFNLSRVLLELGVNVPVARTFRFGVRPSPYFSNKDLLFIFKMSVKYSKWFTKYCLVYYSLNSYLQFGFMLS